jgi:predicted Zn-dependent protease
MASQAAELAPEDPAVQDTLAWIFYKKGLYLQAEKYLKAALQKTPAKEPVAQYQYHLGKSYLKSGETAEGQRLLASALKQNPELAKTETGW